MKSFTYISLKHLKLQQAIDDNIRFYNNERYQERLNGLSRLEYRVPAA
ncbi:IS3 family transposase [Heyndrickxia sporothermodurans]